jgi:hypothetical protein
MLRNKSDKTPYELWKGIPTNVNHFKVFRRKCYIKREYGRIGKLIFESIKAYWLGTQAKGKHTNVSI